MSDVKFTVGCTDTEEAPETLICIHVVSDLRESFSITIPDSSTPRDLYIETSMQTNLSRSFLKLATDTQLIPDNLESLSEYEIGDGSTIYLNVTIEDGMEREWPYLNSSQRAIRSQIFGLTKDEVAEFFEGNYRLELRIPKPENRMGILNFGLGHPMSRDPKDHTESFERALSRKVFQDDDPENVEETFPPEIYSSQGVPAFTVDTMVAIVEYVAMYSPKQLKSN